MLRSKLDLFSRSFHKFAFLPCTYGILAKHTVCLSQSICAQVNEDSIKNTSWSLRKHIPASVCWPSDA